MDSNRRTSVRPYKKGVPMKLFFSPGACGLASQIALREAGFNFDLVRVDLAKKTSTEGDYYKINPKGYVPALQMDSGDVITEGAVILQWIADQKPDKNLIPKFGTTERYKAMEWLNFVATELHKGFSPFFNSSVSGNAEVRQSLMDRVNVRLKFINEHLTKNQFVLGNQFSVADCYLYNILRWAPAIKCDLTSYHGLLGFMERMTQRPSVRAAVEAEGLKL